MNPQASNLDISFQNSLNTTAQQPMPLMSGMQVSAAETSGMAVPSGSSTASSGSMTAPITDTTMPPAMTMESMQYLNGFLRTQIGNRIKVSFLIGTNTYLDRAGKLLAVGANYILLQEAMSDDLLVCDFFNIKFVTIYR